MKYLAFQNFHQNMKRTIPTYLPISYQAFFNLQYENYLEELNDRTADRTNQPLNFIWEVARNVTG